MDRTNRNRTRVRCAAGIGALSVVTGLALASLPAYAASAIGTIADRTTSASVADSPDSADSADSAHSADCAHASGAHESGAHESGAHESGADESVAPYVLGAIDLGGKVDVAEERAYRKWTAGRARTAAVTGVDVDVYFHNFYAKNSQKLTYQQVLGQLQVLNQSFAGGQGGSATRFEFVLAAYENIKVSSATVDVGTARGNRLKRSQHEGGKATLNVYVANRLRAGSYRLSGFGTPPWWVEDHPRLDGIWLRHDVMPGVPGGPAGRGGGDALVHETGHWLGLYHVFQGYCTGRGDQVADTGRMSKRSSQRLDCRSRNSCRHDGGRRDPVRNFMSYSRDACLTSFTGGQAVRMSNMWDRHRA